MHQKIQCAALAWMISACVGTAHSHDIFESQRPTFDCIGELNDAEDMICNAWEGHLAALDRMLNAVYDDRKNEVANSPAPSVEELGNDVRSVLIKHPFETVDELVAEQREWLEYRNSLSDYVSVREAYESRISDLASSTVKLNTSQLDRNMVYTTETEDGSCTGWLTEPDEVEGRCKELAILNRGFQMVLADGRLVITIRMTTPKGNICDATYFGTLSEFNEHYKIEFGANGVELSHRYANTDPCDHWGGLGTRGLGSWGRPVTNY